MFLVATNQSHLHQQNTWHGDILIEAN